VVDRAGNGWGTPRRLEAPVNSDADEYYPSVSARGTLYFSSTREGGRGRGDLYSATWDGRTYSAPVNLGDSINTTFAEGDPVISADENTLIFVSYNRPDGLGDGDLYVSRLQSGQWSKAQNLGAPINSAALDFCPIFSPDGKTFFFTSERTAVDFNAPRRTTYKDFVKQIRGPGNGFGDIYYVDLGVVIGASRR
jgi:Tol biopolymer transport system component